MEVDLAMYVRSSVLLFGFMSVAYMQHIYIYICNIYATYIPDQHQQSSQYSHVLLTSVNLSVRPYENRDLRYGTTRKIVPNSEHIKYKLLKR